MILLGGSVVQSNPNKLKTHKKTLREFLNSVDDFHGTFEQKVNQFYEFALKNTEDTQNLLEEYALQIQKRSKIPKEHPDYLNPSVFSNKFKGLKKFCKVNRIPVMWYSIDQYEPEHDNSNNTPKNLQLLCRRCNYNKNWLL